MDSHTFRLVDSEQTYKLDKVIDNLDGSKRIRLKSVVFNRGFYNVLTKTEIEWEVLLQGQPAERRRNIVVLNDELRERMREILANDENLLLLANKLSEKGDSLMDIGIV